LPFPFLVHRAWSRGVLLRGKAYHERRSEVKRLRLRLEVSGCRAKVEGERSKAGRGRLAGEGQVENGK
jgi:hypothetical protein